MAGMRNNRKRTSPKPKCRDCVFFKTESELDLRGNCENDNHGTEYYDHKKDVNRFRSRRKYHGDPACKYFQPTEAYLSWLAEYKNSIN